MPPLELIANLRSTASALSAPGTVQQDQTIAEKRHGHVPPTTGLQGVGVGPTKVLR